MSVPAKTPAIHAHTCWLVAQPGTVPERKCTCGALSVPRKTPGVQPATYVAEAPVEAAVLEARVRESLSANADVLQQYAELWYHAPHTWHFTHFLNVGIMKSPNDLWMYQEIIGELRPTVIIETGTYTGGSALWYAFLLDMFRIQGRVITIDFEDHRKTKAVEHPKILFLGGDSTNPALVAAISAEIGDRGPRLISLDSDHTAAHVYRELTLYAPLCRLGDYLVVEDTNVSWSGEPGAAGGVQDYVDQHRGEWQQDVLCARFLHGTNTWLTRIAAWNGR